MSSNSAAFLTAAPLVPTYARQTSALCPARLYRVHPARRLSRLASPELRSRPSQVCANLSFGDKVEQALLEKYAENDVIRVLESFRAVRQGQSLETGVGTPQHRRANSYIQGLSSAPFLETSHFPWAVRLENEWEAIARELREVTSGSELKRRGTNIWVAAARQEATAYGPDWRTLVLQDRDWDPVNCGLFPVASGLLRHGDVPSVEAFYARQKAGTGIALHTDDCNFIYTMHLALDVPDSESWIEVGGERRYWENGKALIFDTSFFHQTMNEAKDAERTVLLLRFWHPELTMVERDALGFLFRAIENPELVEGKSEADNVKQAQNVAPPTSSVPRQARRAQRRGQKKASSARGRKRGGGGFG